MTRRKEESSKAGKQVTSKVVKKKTEKSRKTNGIKKTKPAKNSSISTLHCKISNLETPRKSNKIQEKLLGKNGKLSCVVECTNKTQNQSSKKSSPTTATEKKPENKMKTRGNKISYVQLAKGIIEGNVVESKKRKSSIHQTLEPKNKNKKPTNKGSELQSIVYSRKESLKKEKSISKILLSKDKVKASKTNTPSKSKIVEVKNAKTALSIKNNQSGLKRSKSGEETAKRGTKRATVLTKQKTIEKSLPKTSSYVKKTSCSTTTQSLKNSFSSRSQKRNTKLSVNQKSKPEDENKLRNQDQSNKFEQTGDSSTSHESLAVAQEILQHILNSMESDPSTLHIKSSNTEDFESHSIKDVNHKSCESEFRTEKDSTKIEKNIILHKTKEKDTDANIIGGDVVEKELKIHIDLEYNPPADDSLAKVLDKTLNANKKNISKETVVKRENGFENKQKYEINEKYHVTPIETYINSKEVKEKLLVEDQITIPEQNHLSCEIPLNLLQGTPNGSNLYSSTKSPMNISSQGNISTHITCEGKKEESVVYIGIVDKAINSLETSNKASVIDNLNDKKEKVGGVNTCDEKLTAENSAGDIIEKSSSEKQNQCALLKEFNSPIKNSYHKDTAPNTIVDGNNCLENFSNSKSIETNNIQISEEESMNKLHSNLSSEKISSSVKIDLMLTNFDAKESTESVKLLSKSSPLIDIESDHTINQKSLSVKVNHTSDLSENIQENSQQQNLLRDESKKSPTRSSLLVDNHNLPPEVINECSIHNNEIDTCEEHNDLIGESAQDHTKNHNEASTIHLVSDSVKSNNCKASGSINLHLDTAVAEYGHSSDEKSTDCSNNPNAEIISKTKANQIEVLCQKDIDCQNEAKTNDGRNENYNDYCPQMDVAQLDGEDESMQCSSGTQSSNRMSVDEENAAMDLDFVEDTGESTFQGQVVSDAEMEG